MADRHATLAPHGISLSGGASIGLARLSGRTAAAVESGAIRTSFEMPRREARELARPDTPW